MTEITQGALTYLFDLAPTMGDVGDKARQAGFIPVPEKWSQAKGPEPRQG